MADDDHMEEIISSNNTSKKELTMNNVSETLEDKLSFNENSSAVRFMPLFCCNNLGVWGVFLNRMRKKSSAYYSA